MHAPWARARVLCATAPKFAVEISHLKLHFSHFTLQAPHFISFHLISPDLFSPHLISSHLISSHLFYVFSNSQPEHTAQPFTSHQSSSQLIVVLLDVTKYLVPGRHLLHTKINERIFFAQKLETQMHLHRKILHKESICT